MFQPDLVVRSRRVVTPRGTRPAAIHIRAGRIIGIVAIDDVPAGCPIDDASDGVVLPGLVDTHACIETFVSTTRAAAAGGITTIIAMPFHGDDAEGKCAVDVGFWASVSPGNMHELGTLAGKGVFGFACDSASETDLRIIMPAVKWLDATLVSDLKSDTKSDLKSETKSDTKSDTVIRLCREFQTRTHIQLPSSDLLAPLFHARAARLPVSAATSPHSLYVVANDADRETRELLWAALAGGVIQMVVSDRSPLQLSLPVTWTEARPRGYSLDQIAQWMCLAPARLAGLDRKGAIDVGYDADLVVFDPDAELTAELTPYRGRHLRGLVRRTYLKGTRIYQNGSPFAAPCGKLLRRACGHAEPRT